MGISCAGAVRSRESRAQLGTHRSYFQGTLSSMETTAARLLRLLSLLQSRREWTGQELAARLEVSGRTVRHDIQRLRELGYPVDATRGAAGGYRLGLRGGPPAHLRVRRTA